jgi:hypothetical protein
LLPPKQLSPPHPEERRSRVSKDEATARASWFETALTRLLTMKINFPGKFTDPQQRLELASICPFSD